MEKFVKKITTLFCFSLLLLMDFLYSSCQKTFKAETPSYLNIEKIDLLISNASQGTVSNKISDAWVFADDNFLGVYEMPATFPVLINGVHSLKIIPGIKDNGIAASRVQYPFYSF